MIEVDTVRVCGEILCQGGYGENCPCAQKSLHPKSCLRIAFFMQRMIDGELVNLCEQLGIRLVPFVCTRFSELLVDSTQLTVIQPFHHTTIFTMFSHRILFAHTPKLKVVVGSFLAFILAIEDPVQSIYLNRLQLLPIYR